MRVLYGRSLMAVTLVMAFLFLLPWPNSSSWVIGIILGINLMFTGLAVLIYSLAARKTLEVLS